MEKLVILSICLIMLAGCDLAKPQGKKENPGGSTPLAEAVTGMEVAEELQGGAADAPKAEEPTEEPEPETERVKAEVGAGKKGHYGQKGGEQASDILTVPVATLFRAKEMTAFRIQVPQALQLYKAENDGKGPATNEIFMEKIIKEQGIKLPELPDGHKYVYDPEKEELMIEKPK